ncbi:hypothetical protein VULLAG_LOCUS19879 [Vulpes lagopus]
MEILTPAPAGLRRDQKPSVLPRSGTCTSTTLADEDGFERSQKTSSLFLASQMGNTGFPERPATLYHLPSMRAPRGSGVYRSEVSVKQEGRPCPPDARARRMPVPAGCPEQGWRGRGAGGNAFSSREPPNIPLGGFNGKAVVIPHKRSPDKSPSGRGATSFLRKDPRGHQAAAAPTLRSARPKPRGNSPPGKHGHPEAGGKLCQKPLPQQRP